MGDLNTCNHFIPLACSELIDLLCADPSFEGPESHLFRPLCNAITAAYHFEYHTRLLELKKAYTPFDPDKDTQSVRPLPAAKRQHHLNRLLNDFVWLLERAHFTHLGREQIEPVLDSASAWGIRMDVDFSVFEHLAIFARGDTYQKRTRRVWWKGYKVEEAEVPIYRRLVLILKLRDHPRLQGPVNTEGVYLKAFKDIPKLDVMMLLPGARVHLSRFDRSKIGLPLLSGVALAAWNLLGDLVHYVQEALLSPNAMWALTAGGISYSYKSYYGYLQMRQRYHLTLTQSLYFQNLYSNAGVLARLLDEAEEQECCTTILAYYCLWRFAGAEGWTSADLEALMELYLDRYCDVPLLCRSGEPLGKLEKLHLAETVNGRFRAVPPERALKRIQAAWNDYFPKISGQWPVASGQ
jgi:hypothetical protein